jgi:hypothetical protein
MEKDPRSETEMLRNLCSILIQEIQHLRQFIRHKPDCIHTGIYSDDVCDCGLEDSPLSRLEDGENIH